MTDEQLRDHYAKVEAWANVAANTIIYDGVKPTSTCPKSDDLLREAVRAIYNKRYHQSEIDAIEQTMKFVLDALDAHYFGQELPTPANTQQAEALALFQPTWEP